jgi:hypothetical protein
MVLHVKDHASTPEGQKRLAAMDLLCVRGPVTVLLNFVY